MSMSRCHRRSTFAGLNVRESGRTLIELVIAIAISLVILAGVASLYLSASQVSRVANQVGGAQDGAQLALFMVGDAIRTAGFGEIVGSSTTSTLGQTQFDGPQIAACTNGTFTAPWAAPPDLNCVPSGNASGPDQLWVSFQANNVKASPQSALSDCLGQDFDMLNPAHITNIARFGGPSFTNVPVVQNVFGITGTALSCQGRFGATTEALVANTENFKVFFGFDNVRYGAGLLGEVGPVPMARQWTDATALNALAPVGPLIPGSPQPTAWDHVVAVLVCVTVVTNETGLTAQAATTRARCPNTAAEVATGRDVNGLPLIVVDTDGFIRRTVSQVFTIRANAGAYAAIN